MSRLGSKDAYGVGKQIKTNPQQSARFDFDPIFSTGRYVAAKRLGRRTALWLAKDMGAINASTDHREQSGVN